MSPLSNRGTKSRRTILAGFSGTVISANAIPDDPNHDKTSCETSTYGRLGRAGESAVALRLERTTYELSAMTLQVIGSTAARTSGLEDG